MYYVYNMYDMYYRYDTRRGGTMAKLGRKLTYQSNDEKPILVSLRVPRGVYEQVEQYVKMHRMTLTEFILDGIRLRLETPADPRDIILSDDNTVRQELQEMIRAEVQAEIGKLQTFMGSALDALKLVPATEAVPDISYDSNTVLQGSARQTTLSPYDEAESQASTGPANGTQTLALAEVLADTAAFLEDEDDEAMPAPEPPAQLVPEKVHDDNTVLQEGTEQTAIPPYDETKYALGKLCPRGHDYHGTGQTLRRLPSHVCQACDTEAVRQRRKAQKQELDEMASGVRPVPRRSRPKAKHQGQPA
jgi:hypothetical protein